MKDKFEEKLLLYKVQTKQDSDAFAELYNRYIEKVYRFIFFKISHEEEARDLASDTFLRAWDALVQEREKPIQHFGAFVYGIARRLVIDVYRERAKRQETSIDFLGEDEVVFVDQPEERVHNQQEAERLLRLLKKLKQEYHDVMLLRYVEDLSIGEISQILEKGQVAVRVTIHRATQKLKELSDREREKK